MYLDWRYTSMNIIINKCTHHLFIITLTKLSWTVGPRLVTTVKRTEEFSLYNHKKDIWKSLAQLLTISAPLFSVTFKQCIPHDQHLWLLLVATYYSCAFTQTVTFTQSIPHDQRLWLLLVATYYSCAFTQICMKGGLRSSFTIGLQTFLLLDLVQTVHKLTAFLFTVSFL